MAQVDPGDQDVERSRVQSHNTLGTIHRMQGHYDAAAACFQHAIALAEQTLGPEDLDVVAGLNHLAVLYKYQGRFAAAQRLYRRALRIITLALGPDHPRW